MNDFDIFGTGQFGILRKKVSFKVRYETSYGEAIAIVGSNDATGNWQDFSRGLMQWTEGHWWQVTLDIHPQTSFMYKYVVIDY